MTPYEIATKANELLEELGASQNVEGIADKPLSMGSYRQLKAAYEQILNDVLVLIRELAINTQPDVKLPKSGSFDG